MFNSKAIIEFVIPGEAGEKIARLRFPTDQEWASRSMRKKIIQRNVGRGTTQIEQIDYSNVDLEIFNLLKQEDSAEVDAYEAQMILDKISYAEVIEFETGAGEYIITLATAVGDTTHKLRIPSAKEIMQYRRGFARVSDLPHGKQQISINLEAVTPLYDALKKSVDGYSAEVPIIHKSAVLRAAVDAVEQVSGDDGRVNFR
jgi:hypothetical protein